MKNKILNLTLALAVGLSLSNAHLAVYAAIDANTKPTFTSGSGSYAGITQTSTLTNVTLDGTTKGTAIINWKDFNVGSNHTVNWAFGAHSQTALNLVNKTAGLSQIYGKLTNSCASGGSCGYDGTSKVILLNPNGVTFFNGSSVNLNSFTVSTYDHEDKNGKWWKENQTAFSSGATDTWQLVLKKNDGAGDIVVHSGAKIHADKQLAFAAPNVTAYKGSVLSTDKTINYYDQYGYGNIRIFTGDGITFEYRETSNIYGDDAQATATSSTQGVTTLNGEIDTGKLQVVNASTHANSAINVGIAKTGDSTDATKKTIIKATKIVNGEEGAIILEGFNDINIGNATLQALNGSNGSTVSTGKIDVAARGTVNIDGANMSTATTSAGTGHINVISFNEAANVKNSTLNASNNVYIAGKTGSTVSNSTVTGNNVTVGQQTYANKTVTSQNNTISGSTITARNGFAKILANVKNAITGSTVKATTSATVTANTGNNEITGNSKIEGKTASVTATAGSNTITSSTVNATSGAATVTGKTGNTLNKGTVTATTAAKVTSASGNNSVTNSSTIKGTTADLIASAGTNTLTSSTVNATSGAAKADGAKGNTINGGTVTGTTTATVTAASGNNTISNNSTIKGTNSAVITATAGQNSITGSAVTGPTTTITGKTANVIDSSTVNATNATVEATAGDNTIRNSSTITTTTTANVTASGNNTVNSSKIYATTANVTAGTNNTITSSTIAKNSAGDMANAIKVAATSGTNTIKSSTLKGNTVTLTSGTLTDVDASDLYYNTLALTGNLRIANDSSFSDMDDTTGKVAIQTNGYIKVEDSANIYNKKSGTKTKHSGLTLKSTGSYVALTDATVNAINAISVEAGNGAVTMTNSTVKSDNTTATVKGSTNVTMSDSDVTAKGNANVTATSGSAKLTNSTVESTGANANVTAYNGFNDASLTGSTIKAAKNVTLKTTNGSITLSNLGAFDYGERLILNAAKNITVGNGANLDIVNTDFQAGGNVTLKSTAGRVTFDDVTAKNAAKVDVDAKTTISTLNGTALDVTGSMLDMLAEGNVNVKLAGVGDKTKGVKIEGYDVTVDAGDLSVSKLYSHNNMYLNVDNIIASNQTNPVAGDTPGLDENGNAVAGKDSTPRAYIRVDGWTFESEPTYSYDNAGLTGSEELAFSSYDVINTTKPGEADASDFNRRHYITYSTNGEAQKIFLVYKQPAVCDDLPPAINPGYTDPGYTDSAFETANILRLPLKYELTSNSTPIANNTVGMDVVQQAAQVQVTGDEEDEYGF